MSALIHHPRLGFLDGFDGERYEWTRDPAGAWHMSPEEAFRRLPKVKEAHPGSDVISDRNARKLARRFSYEIRGSGVGPDGWFRFTLLRSDGKTIKASRKRVAQLRREGRIDSRDQD